MDIIQTSITSPWAAAIFPIAAAAVYLIWRAYGKNKFKGFSGSSMLGIYTRDLTAEARAGRIEPWA